MRRRRRTTALPLFYLDIYVRFYLSRNYPRPVSLCSRAVVVFTSRPDGI